MCLAVADNGANGPCTSLEGLLVSPAPADRGVAV